MALQANCPSCGAQVLFKTGSSVVVVCEFCRSVVARTDRGIEDAGKVADVAEKGTARSLAAEGEIPYLLTPGETYAYADLSGQSGAFGTLDYGESPPLVFVGREVSLEELGLANAERVREREARAVTAAQLNCPNCAGALELRAPDAAERVTCPNCGSLLDVNQGKLRYLKRLKRKGPPPSIPLGATAEFEGQPQTVIGFMVRSVEFDGVC